MLRPFAAATYTTDNDSTLKRGDDDDDDDERRKKMMKDGDDEDDDDDDDNQVGKEARWKSMSSNRFMNERPTHDDYIPTDLEQLANIITHGVWILPSLAGLCLMQKLADSTVQSLAVLIYGCSIFLLFSVSTAFHSLAYYGRSKQLKNFFHMSDRVAIYIFIAASYTPWLALKDFNRFGTLMIWIVWTAAVVGITYQYKYHDRSKCLETLLYVFIATMPSVIIFEMLAWCINWILNPPLLFQFMLICKASASAGAVTNLFSVLSRARLNLNILSLLITPFLGIVAVPVWVIATGNGLLSREFVGYEPRFPWLQFLGLKALFLMPGILVICIKLMIPSRARTMSLVIRLIASLWVTIMLVLLAVDLIWTLEYAKDWRVFMGPVVLLVAGGIIIFPLSYLLTRDSKSSLTMTIQGIVANPSYSILLCIIMVPRPFTAIPVCISIIYLISIVLLALISTLIIRLWQHFTSKKTDSTDSNSLKFTCQNELETV